MGVHIDVCIWVQNRIIETQGKIIPTNGDILLHSLHCRHRWPHFLDQVVMKLFLTVKDIVLIRNFQVKLFHCSDNMPLLFSDGSVPHLCAMCLVLRFIWSRDSVRFRGWLGHL